jgi:hypothetical protein
MLHPLKTFLECVDFVGSSVGRYIKNDEILGQVTTQLSVPNPKYQGQKVLLLPVEYVPGWLFYLFLILRRVRLKLSKSE